MFKAICAALVAIGLLSFSACGDDDTDGATTTASLTAPAGGPTGVSDVDRAIAGIEQKDAGKLDALLQFTKLKCATNPQGIGSPPKCPGGVADGTTVEAVLTGNCEGSWILKDQKQSVVKFIQEVSGSAPLYAVVYAVPPSASVDSGGLPPSKYTIVYGRPGQATSWYVSVDSGIVSAFNGCAQPPEEIAKRRDTSKPNSGFLLAPKP